VRLIAIYLDRHHQISREWARQNRCKPQERWAIRELLHDGSMQSYPTWERASFTSWNNARKAIHWLEQNPHGTYEGWLKSRRNSDAKGT
jgi:hypothetical protein